MSARETAELLLLMGRPVQADGYHGKLSPAQWMALRYFARANWSPGPRRLSRNFKRRPAVPHHKRSRRLRQAGIWSDSDPRRMGEALLPLTDKGHEVVARDPFEVLVRAVASLDAQEQTAMRDALHRVLTTIAASGAHQHFGVCQDCAYLGGEMYCDSTSASRSALGCLLFGVPIEPDDAGLLCVHFQRKNEHREDGHRE